MVKSLETSRDGIYITQSNPNSKVWLFLYCFLNCPQNTFMHFFFFNLGGKQIFIPQFPYC